MKRKRHQSAHDEGIEAQAAAWLAQRDAGFTAEDAAQFAAWRKADLRHEAAVVRLEAAWGALQQLRDFRPEARAHPDHDLLAPPRARVRPPWPALAAAALVMLAAIAGWRLARPAGADAPVVATQVFATPESGYQQTTLADGSWFELNSGTELQVSYTPNERHIRMVRGEAHFSVVKDRLRPFVVEAAGVAIRAVGTAFNVKHAADAVEIVVTEGRVQVAPAARDGAALAVLDAGQRSLLELGAGPITAARVESLPPHALREKLSWRGPRLVFSETPLADVVAQFNRHNRVQLVVADSELHPLPVGGSFRADNVEAFVRLLASDRDILVDRSSPDLYVIRRAGDQNTPRP